MERYISPRDLAAALGVSESSLKRWVDAGRIPASRTSGGHRRIARADAIAFVRSSGMPIAHPEYLGLPVAGIADLGRSGTDLAHAPDLALPSQAQLAASGGFGALVAGDVVALRSWAATERAAGVSLAALCDGPLREAMHTIGSLWQHDPDGVFVEHRATEVAIQFLAVLRSELPPPAADAPVAVGGGPEDDPYSLPSAMVALVLAAAGYRAVNLGPDTPTPALRRAVMHFQPAVVWVSASAPLPVAQAHEIADLLTSLPAGTTAVTGGRYGSAIPGVTHVTSLAHLLSLVPKLAVPG